MVAAFCACAGRSQLPDAAGDAGRVFDLGNADSASPIDAGKPAIRELALLGNSYTRYPQIAVDLPALLSVLRPAATVTPSVLLGAGFNHYLDFEQQLSDPNLGEWARAVKTTFDDFSSSLRPGGVAILQAQSTESVDRATVDKFIAGGVKLANVAYQAGARPVFLMTWPRHPLHAFYKEGVKYEQSANSGTIDDFEMMLAVLEKRFAELVGKVGDQRPTGAQAPLLLPVGVGFSFVYFNKQQQLAACTAANLTLDQLYASDGSHPSPVGVYLAAATIYHFLWQAVPPVNSAIAGVTVEQQRCLAAIAAEAR